MNKGKVNFISISEIRDLYIFKFAGPPMMEMRREACIQRERPNGRVSVRYYTNATESSILRLARIQEKLHNQ